MRTSTAVALGLGALVLAGGGTAAVLYLTRKGQPVASPPLPKAEGERIVYTSPNPKGTAAPAPGAQVPGSDAQKVAADVKAYADAAKSVAGALGDVATQLKGFFAD